MRKTNNRYVIYVQAGKGVALFFGIGDNTAFLTTLFPVVYPNKKKAKRVLSRLNSYHGHSGFQWRIADLNNIQRPRGKEWRDNRDFRIKKTKIALGE